MRRKCVVVLSIALMGSTMVGCRPSQNVDPANKEGTVLNGDEQLLKLPEQSHGNGVLPLFPSASSWLYVATSAQELFAHERLVVTRRHVLPESPSILHPGAFESKVSITAVGDLPSFTRFRDALCMKPHFRILRYSLEPQRDEIHQGTIDLTCTYRKSVDQAPAPLPVYPAAKCVLYAESAITEMLNHANVQLSGNLNYPEAASSRHPGAFEQKFDTSGEGDLPSFSRFLDAVYRRPHITVLGVSLEPLRDELYRGTINLICTYTKDADQNAPEAHLDKGSALRKPDMGPYKLTK